MPKNKKQIITFSDAIRESIFSSLKKDKRVFLMGEGVDDPSSMWGTIKGAAKKFGKNRVLEMPVAENGLIGSAIGSAYMGSRPIINLQRVEFALLALEQIFNNAAKSHYVSNGAHKVPLVIRLVIGRGWGQGPEHSQSLEAVFSHFPGLKVIMPCFPDEAKGLLTAAVEDDNPIIFIEHRWLHFAKGKVPNGYYKLPLESLSKISSGSDLTLVSTSISTLEALRAVNFLKKHGLKIDFYNLRILRPLNIKKLYGSIKKTKKIITVDTGFVKHGIGSEIIASLLEKNLVNNLKVRRLGLPDFPTPSSRGLIKNYYPSAKSIIESCLDLVNISKKNKMNILNDFMANNKVNLPIDIPHPSFKGPF